MNEAMESIDSILRPPFSRSVSRSSSCSDFDVLVQPTDPNEDTPDLTPVVGSSVVSAKKKASSRNHPTATTTAVVGGVTIEESLSSSSSSEAGRGLITANNDDECEPSEEEDCGLKDDHVNAKISPLVVDELNVALSRPFISNTADDQDDDDDDDVQYSPLLSTFKEITSTGSDDQDQEEEKQKLCVTRRITNLEDQSSITTSEEVETNNRGQASPVVPNLFRRRLERRNETFEKGDYISKRTMTPFQERMNAITVLPGALFCLHYVLSGGWMSSSSSESHDFNERSNNNIHDNDSHPLLDAGCLSISWLPSLHALPPAPVLAVAIGIIVHAPFSFVYHWHYCTTLPPGLARLEHWSRRADQAFIHFISACMSYGTSGRVDYFLVNALFNGHCMRKMFEKEATPRKNQMRIGVSVVAYTLPILKRGYTETFVNLWLLFFLASYFFAKYPIGGWSHSAFHFVIAFVPPILFQTACLLAVSQEQIRMAATCASSSLSGYI